MDITTNQLIVLLALMVLLGGVVWLYYLNEIKQSNAEIIKANNRKEKIALEKKKLLLQDTDGPGVCYVYGHKYGEYTLTTRVPHKDSMHGIKESYVIDHYTAQCVRCGHLGHETVRM